MTPCGLRGRLVLVVLLRLVLMLLRGWTAWPWTLAPWRTTKPATHSTLLARGDHREGDLLFACLHFHDPHGNHVSDRHDVVRALDVAVGHLADVNQRLSFEPNVNERTERDDVQDRTPQLHALRDAFQFQHALLEDRWRQVLAWVASGLRQRIDNVPDSWLPGVQTVRKLGGVDSRQLAAKLSQLGLVAQIRGCEPKVGQDLPGDGVALGVNPGGIERVGPIGNLQGEARGLGEPLFFQPGNSEELLPAGELALTFCGGWLTSRATS